MNDTAARPDQPGWIENVSNVIRFAIDHLEATAVLAALIAGAYYWHQFRIKRAAAGRPLRGLFAIATDVVRFAYREDAQPVITKPAALATRTAWLTGKRLYLIGLPLAALGWRLGLPGAALTTVGIILVLGGRAHGAIRRRHAIIMQMFNVAAGECRYPKDAVKNPWAYITVQRWLDPVTPGTTIVTYPAAYQSEDAKIREKFERQFNGTVSDKNAWTYTWESAKNRVLCQPSSFLPTMASYPGPGPEWSKIPIGMAGDGGVAQWDVETFPHALVCGPTGTGKSVLQRNILFHVLSHSDSWRIVGIDPKKVEMAWLRGYPSVTKVATELEESIEVLRQLKAEMRQRYQEMEAEGVNHFRLLADPPPAILLMIDETTILLAPEKIRSEEGKERDELHAEAGMIVGELGRLARAAGIHVIACMQRPDAEFLKGETKANFDCRIVAGRCDTTPSMMILDSEAATRLPLIKGRGMIRLGGTMQTFQGYFAEATWYDEYLSSTNGSGAGAADDSERDEDVPSAPPGRGPRRLPTPKPGSLRARLAAKAATPPAGDERRAGTAPGEAAAEATASAAADGDIKTTEDTTRGLVDVPAANTPALTTPDPTRGDGTSSAAAPPPPPPPPLGPPAPLAAAPAPLEEAPVAAAPPASAPIQGLPTSPPSRRRPEDPAA